MKVIDVDRLFEKYLRGVMQKNVGKYTEEEWEEKLPALYEKFCRNTCNSSLRLILGDYYKRKRAALVEQAHGLDRDDPRYADLVHEIGDISKLLLALPQKYKVII